MRGKGFTVMPPLGEPQRLPCFHSRSQGLSSRLLPPRFVFRGAVI